MTKPVWLGSFRGDDLSEEQLDAIIAFGVQATDIEAARALHETKWWDYRYIHPGFGFFLFAHEYGHVVERWRTKFGVHYKAVLSASDHPIWRTTRKSKGNITVTTGERTLTPPGYRTSMWRAMCFADAYGVPYDRWIALAFEYAFECKWERLPQPSGLYSEGMVKFILDRWEREQSDILKLPNDPRYLPVNDQGHRWQKAQQEWLVELIRNRPLPHIPLAQYLFREARISEDLAIRRLGSDVVDKARSLVSR